MATNISLLMMQVPGQLQLLELSYKTNNTNITEVKSRSTHTRDDVIKLTSRLDEDLASLSSGLNEKISVIQIPVNITVNEGESAEITCCWTQTTIETSNVKVVWLKNDTKVSAENHLNQTSPSQNCSTLHITHITSEDEGEYVCKVTKDIPILTEGRGNKTILTVIKMYVPTEDEKPLVKDNPKKNPKDETSLDGHFVDSSNESIEQPGEDLESGNKRRNDAEDVKQGERGSVEEEERDTTEKLKTAEKAEDEKDKQEEEKDLVLLLDTEAVMVITGNREESADSLVGSGIVSVL
ncbi:hypothetical protein E1301_Tti019124 [Triplophysa tibetana]|uniref:Ig-like domain-containing protein n=1 Tax=Triplophysa tibetana TaxID=1572043 RepID=A0A5A9PDB6_9TELE|nr:hypothetical protein E1301_Tti019124 [Triplophysa tibetana]